MIESQEVPNLVKVLLQQLDAELPVPSYAHPGDAGLDLYSSVDHVLEPGQRQLIPTGIAIALPPGYVAFVHPRSGLAHKHGIGMVNAPGVIDAGYRGEIKVNLINHDPQASFEIKRGERVAQLVIQLVSHAQFVPVEALPGSDRGEGGFGSTGTS
ncbi:MAG: dUTP diphosphatase [Candidatus Nanopelagicales bacterium]